MPLAFNRLERELDFALHYLAVERIRFGEKLNVEVKVAPEALPVLVPRLLLQPLAGNAVKHAIPPHHGGHDPPVRRTPRRSPGARDRRRRPGEAPGPLPAVRTGVGLANTRARLAAAYRNDFQMELIRGPREECWSASTCRGG